MCEAKSWLQTLSAGAYGLPQLPGSAGFKLYDDFDQEYVFEYPRSWVGRSNSLRQGVYVSDFNVSSLLSCHILASIAHLQHRSASDQQLVEAPPPPPPPRTMIHEILQCIMDLVLHVSFHASCICADSGQGGGGGVS